MLKLINCCFIKQAYTTSFIFAKNNHLLPSTTVINYMIGNSFFILDTVDSTNSYASFKLKEKMAEHGTVFFAKNQFNGKGQYGKKWVSEPESNIIMSAVVDVSALKLTNAFAFSAMVAVKVFEFFKHYVGNNACIKWPNDIFWNDSKAGGILIENILQGATWKWAIVGIGINVNQTVFDTELLNATSIKNITGQSLNAAQLAKELCTYLNDGYTALLNGTDFLPLYNAALYKRNELVKFKKDNAVFSCLIKEVNNFGQLIVERGFEEKFEFGGVQWIIN